MIARPAIMGATEALHASQKLLRLAAMQPIAACKQSHPHDALDGWMDGWMGGWMDGCIEGPIDQSVN